MPGVAAADNDSCVVEVTAGTDLAGPAPSYSCAIRHTCGIGGCGFGRLYANVSGVGQVGMRIEETAGGNRAECVGVSHCAVEPTVWSWPRSSPGETEWLVCTLHNYAAADIHMECLNDTSF